MTPPKLAVVLEHPWITLWAALVVPWAVAFRVSIQVREKYIDWDVALFMGLCWPLVWMLMCGG